RAGKKTSNSAFQLNWLRADPHDPERKTCNGNTLLQGTAYRRLSDQAEAAGPKTLSAGADAGAAVSLQPRLCRLRQDRLSRRDPQSPHVGAGMLGRRRRVRRADGGVFVRRAADPP